MIFFKFYKKWICKSEIIQHDIISLSPASPPPRAKGKSSGFNVSSLTWIMCFHCKGMCQSQYFIECPQGHVGRSLGQAQDGPIPVFLLASQSEDTRWTFLSFFVLWCANYKNSSRWFPMENFGLGVWVTLTCRNMVAARSTAALGKPHVPCRPCVRTCLGGAVCSFCLWSVCVFTCQGAISVCVGLSVSFLPTLDTSPTSLTHFISL